MKKKTMKWLGLTVMITAALTVGVLFLIQPPKIPHKITEGMNCKSCHATGANGAPVSPHPNKPNCLSCHKVK
ncbi:hypothetical protein [Desulfosporosinus sp. SB140]|uniref:hypothetical protein n=1 Tax=Desulfosporosinus paludis TaxID=3115649 RepID=UPI003890A307